MLSPAELEQMLVEDRQQRAHGDHRRLMELGIIERKFNPAQPRDPGGDDGGQWVKSPTSAAKAAVKKIVEALDDDDESSFADLIDRALTKQDALDATSAKLKRAPGGHTGDYTGEALHAPAGHGSVRALSEYEGAHYGSINGYLRDPKRHELDNDPLWADDIERVREIDKTMAVSRLKDDVRVDRIIQHGQQVFGRDVWWNADMNSDDFDVQDAGFERWEAGERPDLTGLRWIERGYSSTTADPKVAEDFGGRWRQSNSSMDGEPVIMRILAPKGTGAVQLAEMGHAAEILLQRDLTFEVAADHGVDADGYRRLDVRVVTDVE